MSYWHNSHLLDTRGIIDPEVNMTRSYEVGRYPDVLSIDSGWNDDEVTLDVKTARGKTVTLTVHEWRVLVFNVENIIAHCEQQRQKQRREKLKRL